MQFQFSILKFILSIDVKWRATWPRAQSEVKCYALEQWRSLSLFNQHSSWPFNLGFDIRRRRIFFARKRKKKVSQKPYRHLNSPGQQMWPTNTWWCSCLLSYSIIYIYIHIYILGNMLWVHTHYSLTRDNRAILASSGGLIATTIDVFDDEEDDSFLENSFEIYLKQRTVIVVCCPFEIVN